MPADVERVAWGVGSAARLVPGASCLTQALAGQSSEQDSTDCVGSNRVTKFDILVEFGNAPSAAASSASPDAGAAPTSTAQNLDKAQTAGEQAQAASSSAAASATGGAK